MTEEARLRECPFCGSHNVELWRGDIVGRDRELVRCLDCGASTAYYLKGDAITAWNKRAHERALKPTTDR